MLLSLLSMFILLGSCQHKGILRCPKPPGKSSKISIKGPNSQSMQGVSVPMDKNGRVQKKRGLFGGIFNR
ncbi:hypothetical protein H8S84_13445 [Pontibacter sp. SD6]|uniref:Uncharacterized protein n=1 Tax=Pontibacter cellulosilyticus TaxID=1720253 RepID=A0A923NBE4_9BACT|nr:hypothetical protein [Pontibacter cellulosilyticus]